MTASKETIKNEDQFHDAVQSLGAFYGITGLQIEIKPGAGTGCLPVKGGGLKVQVDPLQIARNKLAGEDAGIQEMDIRQVDALYVAGEQVGRVRDIIDGGIPRTTNKRDRFFWHAVSDTAIGAQLRRIPLLDSVTDDIYKEFRFPEGSLRQDPKHVQFMEAVLLRTVVPNGKWQFDPEIEELIHMLKNYPLGKQTVDVLEALSHHETSVGTRLKIADQILRPIFEKLFQEDVEQGRADSQDSDDSEDGEGGENGDQKQKGSRQKDQNSSNKNQDTQDSSDSDKSGQDGDGGQEQGQGSQDNSSGQSRQQDQNESDGNSGGDSSQFSNSYDQYEIAMRGGVNDEQGDGQGDSQNQDQLSKEMRDLMRDYGFPFPDYDDDEYDDDFDDSDDSDGDGAGSQADSPESDGDGEEGNLESRMAGTVQQEMQLDKSDARKYVEVLSRYRHVISETAEVLLKLSNIAESTSSPQYKTIADEKGRRIHPARLMQAVAQLETKRPQPIWQPLEHINVRSEFVFGGLDITLIVDVSASMSGAKGDNAGAIAIILLEAIELAAKRTEIEQRQNTPPDVRSRVIAFGSDTKELSPVQYQARPIDKGRTFKNLIHPNSSSTLVEGSLKKVLETASKTPQRDHIVFIISDAIFGDFEKAKAVAGSMPENVLLTQFEINEAANYTMNEKTITPYNQVVKKPEQLPGAVLRVIWDYIESFDQP